MYAGKSLKEARVQAQANADYFRASYRLFTDVSGNLRIEQIADGTTIHEGDEIFKPVGENER